MILKNTSAQSNHTRKLILGASGFIGMNLCHSLANGADFVRTFSRTPIPSLKRTGWEYLNGDFSCTEDLERAVKDVDIVFHLINDSTPASANADKLGDLDRNVGSTIRLLDACVNAGVRRVVFVSSGGTVYGIPKHIPTPESAETFPITAYGISKLAIEKYLSLYEHQHGLEYRVLRVANPYGPFQITARNQGVIAAYLQAALRDRPIEIWGDGTVVRDYVYVSDVVDALLLASNHQGVDRIFNIGSGQGRSLSEIVDSISRLIGTRITTLFSPSRTVDVPVSTLDCRLAHEKLLWRSKIGFDEGLIHTLNWMKEHNFQPFDAN